MMVATFALYLIFCLPLDGTQQCHERLTAERFPTMVECMAASWNHMGEIDDAGRQVSSGRCLRIRQADER